MKVEKARLDADKAAVGKTRILCGFNTLNFMGRGSRALLGDRLEYEDENGKRIVIDEGKVNEKANK